MNEIIKISYEQLRNNCVYSSIAHAVFTLKEPFFSYAQSWDGYNYSFHYGTTRGTISFYEDKKIAVGAARDEQSSRRKLYPKFEAVMLFNEASDQIKTMASRDPLEYLYDEAEDIVKPMASIGFWLNDDSILSADNIEDFNLNGGAYIFIVSQAFDALIQYWKDEYCLSEDEIAVINLMYRNWELKRQISSKDVKHVINKKRNGYNECIESLTEIGIRL